MEPHVTGVGVDLLLQDADRLTLTTAHLAHLFIEKACNDDAELVNVNDQIIHSLYRYSDIVITTTPRWRDACDGSSLPCPRRLKVRTYQAPVLCRQVRCAMRSKV